MGLGEESRERAWMAAGTSEGEGSRTRRRRSTKGRPGRRQSEERAAVRTASFRGRRERIRRRRSRGRAVRWSAAGGGGEGFVLNFEIDFFFLRLNRVDFFKRRNPLIASSFYLFPSKAVGI